MRLDDWKGPFAVLATVVCLIAIGKYPPQQSSDIAAWIQAFGSIAAIAGSAYLVWYQTDAARRQALQTQLAEQKRQSEGLFAICQLANEQTHAAAAAFQGDVIDELALAMSYSERFFNETFYALDSIQLGQLGFPEAVPAFIRLKLAYGAIGRAIGSSRFGDGSAPQTDMALSHDIRESERLVATQVETLRKILVL